MAFNPSQSPSPAALFSGNKLAWANYVFSGDRKSLHVKKNIGSPLESFYTVAEHASELTPASEQLTRMPPQDPSWRRCPCRR